MVNNSKEREERGEAQAIEGYGCICGFKTADKKEIARHFLSAGKRDGKGIHKSLGRINLQTGEVIMPPWSERSDEQKSDRRTKKSDAERPVKPTEVLSDAQLLKFVPKVYTTEYSSIMRAGQEAAKELWGWPDMSLGDYLDTVIHMFYKEKGIILAGYIVSNEAKEAIKEKAKQEEETHGS